MMISIHALLAESDRGRLLPKGCHWISIHALLAESDPLVRCNAQGLADFYPRSPCGERPTDSNNKQTNGKFLSTLSLRRATHQKNQIGRNSEISIHALLAESDVDY